MLHDELERIFTELAAAFGVAWILLAVAITTTAVLLPLTLTRHRNPA